MQAPQDPATVQHLYEQITVMGFCRSASTLREETTLRGIALFDAQIGSAQCSLPALQATASHSVAELRGVIPSVTVPTISQPSAPEVANRSKSECTLATLTTRNLVAGPDVM